MFGNVNAAIPFLLDLLRIPADTFHLFVTSGIVNARFGTLVAAVHTAGDRRARHVRGGRNAHVRRPEAAPLRGRSPCCLTIGVVGGTRGLLRLALNQPLRQGRDADRDGPAARSRRRQHLPSAVRRCRRCPPVTTSVLDRVRDRGVLRVGYFEDSLPYAFVNRRGELVGFDVEMAFQLARDLGVQAELVPVDRTVIDAGLDASVCDLVMSGVVVTADRSMHVRFSAPISTRPSRSSSRTTWWRPSRSGRACARWGTFGWACRARRTSSARFARS